MTSKVIPRAWVSPEVQDQLFNLARSAAPEEACGIITPTLTVMCLPNSSSYKETSFTIRAHDLAEALGNYIRENEFNPEDILPEHFIVWHSHPSGNVGPSKLDMQQQHPFQRLVITLPNGELTYY